MKEPLQQAPDGLTHPMSENDLIMVRKYLPDLDAKLDYSTNLPPIKSNTIVPKPNYGKKSLDRLD
jgi:hypothetical protein